MVFTIIEWFVLIFSILATIKLLFVIFNPKGWLKIIEPLYKARIILFIVESILAFTLFYYLLKERTS